MRFLSSFWEKPKPRPQPLWKLTLVDSQASVKIMEAAGTGEEAWEKATNRCVFAREGRDGATRNVWFADLGVGAAGSTIRGGGIRLRGFGR